VEATPDLSRSSPAGGSAAPGDGLTPKRAQFVREYLVDLNAAGAAVRAGYRERRAKQQASELLRTPAVAAAIEAAMAERSARLRINADMVVERWWRIATADPNDLVQLRRGCCRYCHGADHLYQWIDAEEFGEAVAASAKAKAPVVGPSDAGGYGYRASSPAHPDCPRCGGRGVAEVFAADTRTLSGDAALLYAGVKETSGGIEIRMHDQAKALENVARHLGLFKDQVEHTGVTTVEIVRLTP